jgi:hypothetical protein
LNSAVRAPPIWRNPVGEGAKRVTMGSVIDGASGWLFGRRLYSRNRA